MFSDKIFQITLAISFLVHGVILFQNAGLNPLIPKEKVRDLEVSYLKENKSTNTISKKEPFEKSSQKLTLKKLPPPPQYREGEAGMRPELIKPNLAKPEITASNTRKKISLPPVGLDKINNPSYISYYQIVREKIRRAAYQNYMRTETGEVHLSFVISNTGNLLQVKLVEDTLPPDSYLKEVALLSIKEAAPFPPFSKELDYPHLSFNVIISFEVE